MNEQRAAATQRTIGIFEGQLTNDGAPRCQHIARDMYSGKRIQCIRPVEHSENHRFPWGAQAR